MSSLDREPQLPTPELQPLEQVAVKCTQRSDVDYGESLSIVDLQKLVKNWKQYGFSFARSCRCDEKNVLPTYDFWNGRSLRWSGGFDSGLGNRLLERR